MENIFKIILTALFFIQCNFALSQNSVIKGKVYDNETKLPLNGAVVSLTDYYQTTSSNELGDYYFPNLFEGSYKIKIEFVGYKAQIINIELRSGETSTPTTYLTANALTISQIDVTATIDYGKISVSPIDMILRPTSTAQDLLKLVPGLFIAQHAGGGKAEQLFLRGFDIDHGTDINIQVDGIPVNMTSHAHGQGYADLHFVIPETIEGFDVYKGPYYSKFGDLATSGSVEFITKNSIEKSMGLLEYGRFDYYRGLVMLNVLGKKTHLLSRMKESLYLASEYTYSNGYTDDPQKFNRLNVFGKYYGMLSDKTILSLSGSTFYSHWNASGQIPTRAVNENMIGRFGSIDNTEGGNTYRTNFNFNLLNSFDRNVSLTNQFYYSAYGFNLYSNFTFFLNDSLNGDQINQYESRNIYGYKGVLSILNHTDKTNFTTNIGIGVRIDDIDSIFLAHTYKREFLSFTNAGKILQQNYFTYLNETIEIEKFVFNPGLRFDYFNFNLNDDLNDSNSGNVSEVKFAPKLNLFYNLNDKTQFYIKTGVGFHSNDARVVVVEKNENTLPAALGYEIGTVFNIGNALISTSLWGLNIESEFVYVGDEAVVEPSGKTRRLGIDFSGRYQFNNWLWADLDLDYAKGKFLDEPEEANRIPLAPVFTSVGGLSVRLNNGISGRLGYRYLDDRPANEANSVIAEGYFVVDAVLNYNFAKNYQIGLTVENLTNNSNWNEAQFDTESRLQSETDPVSELHYTPGTPFNVKGNFSIYF
ncbi:MAG: TonB-dependent receptor [Ignavibacteria bacterium]|nr:TonB-dependent receptor [Ignavibacteria bacterium]